MRERKVNGSTDYARHGLRGVDIIVDGVPSDGDPQRALGKEQHTTKLVNLTSLPSIKALLFGDRMPTPQFGLPHTSLDADMVCNTSRR